jgi:hypothetical protein
MNEMKRIEIEKSKIPYGTRLVGEEERLQTLNTLHQAYRNI